MDTIDEQGLTQLAADLRSGGLDATDWVDTGPGGHVVLRLRAEQIGLAGRGDIDFPLWELNEKLRLVIERRFADIYNGRESGWTPNWREMLSVREQAGVQG